MGVGLEVTTGNQVKRPLCPDPYEKNSAASALA